MSDISSYTTDRRMMSRIALQDGFRGPVLDSQGYWWPQKDHVAVQFMTRYVFFALGSLFFLTIENYRAVVLSLDSLLVIYGVYFAVNTVLFLMAMRRLGVASLRLGMVVDMLMVTVSVIHDPYPVPPSAMAYLMVVLGNGMRYGMRPFAESAVLATLGMVLSYGIRYRLGGFTVTPADLFYGIFWSVLVFYAFLLMGQVDAQRKLLAYRSRYDALTGVLNRNGFIDSADAFIKQATPDSPRSLLFVDINEFRSVNDRFGHAAGDRVLREIGRILEESTESDLVCRWGGDEFVVLLAKGEEYASECVSRIQERIRLWARGNGLPVGVSLGMSQTPADGMDLETLLSVADIKLYKCRAGQD